MRLPVLASDAWCQACGVYGHAEGAEGCSNATPPTKIKIGKSAARVTPKKEKKSKKTPMETTEITPDVTPPPITKVYFGAYGPKSIRMFIASKSSHRQLTSLCRDSDQVKAGFLAANRCPITAGICASSAAGYAPLSERQSLAR